MIGTPELLTFEAEFGTAGRALSRLIRPAITAPVGRTIVWGDWAAIEARGLPWLADTEGSRAVLQVIREADADPENKPDLYCREAAGIEGTDLDEFWARYRDKDPAAKAARQTGKVAVLSLGFGGAVGALLNMAAGYRISLTEAEGRVIVDKWRENNRWARGYWDALWEGALRAMDSPDTPIQIGRVVYMYDKGYLGGTLMCFLPDGRPLTYPEIRWERRERENHDGTKEMRNELTYRRGYERRSLWYGVLAENNTQAACGSLLRAKIVALSPAPPLPGQQAAVGALGGVGNAFLIGHTHDELIAECDDNEDSVHDTRRRLRAEMVRPTHWSEGLPLAADISDNWYYTKVGD